MPKCLRISLKCSVKSWKTGLFKITWKSHIWSFISKSIKPWMILQFESQVRICNMWRNSSQTGDFNYCLSKHKNWQASLQENAKDNSDYAFVFLLLFCFCAFCHWHLDSAIIKEDLNSIVLQELFKHFTMCVSSCVYPKSSSGLNYLIKFLVFFGTSHWIKRPKTQRPPLLQLTFYQQRY